MARDVVGFLGRTQKLSGMPSGCDLAYGAEV
jgi:hypothetical protein